MQDAIRATYLWLLDIWKIVSEAQEIHRNRVFPGVLLQYSGEKTLREAARVIKYDIYRATSKGSSPVELLTCRARK